MKKIYFLLGLAWLLCFFSTQVFAQTATAAWALSNPSGTTPGTGLTATATGQINAPDEKLSILTINGYTGTESSQRLSYMNNIGWPASQTDTISNVYVEFSVTPKEGYDLTVNTVSLKIGGSGGSNLKATIYYSTEPSFRNPTQIPYSAGTNDLLTNGSMYAVSAQLNSRVANGKTFYVRVYPWLHNQTSSLTGKYLNLKDVVISGTTEAAGASTIYSLAVTTQGQGAVSPSTGTFAKDEQVTLTATAEAGWQFSGWSGDATGSTNPLTVTMNANKAITATFTQIQATRHTLTVSTVGQGAVSPNGGSFNQGEEVILTATAAAGWQFSGWSGDATGTANPLTVTMSADKAVTATFTQVPATTYALTVTTVGQGLVNPNSGTYSEGEMVTLTATAAAGWQFSGWSGAATGMTNPLTLTMNSAKAITATFHQIPAGPMNQASATWALTNPSTGGTGGAVATAGQMAASKQQLKNMDLNGYTGINTSQRARILGNSWPAGQTDTIAGTYMQFSVAATANNKLTVKSISYKIASHSGNGMRARVFYSTDRSFKTATEIVGGSGAADYVVSNSELQPVSVNLSAGVAEGDSLYLRFYPWYNVASTGKYITLQDVTISGETEAMAVPSQIVWASDQTFSVTGALIGQAPTYSPAMKYYGQTDLPITDTNANVNVMAVQTVSQDWQAEPNPVESLYFQYAVKPKTGASFHVTNVSLALGGWYSSNLKAAIYYSKDPSFAQRTLLVADRALVGNKVEPISVDLNATVNSDETFYVRIYPHNTMAEGWAKLVAVHKFTITGSAIGVTVDPAVVSTVAQVSRISTTSATSGGNISTDGGSAVTARGVVWGTSENPTVDGNKTQNGTGSGAFSSEMTSLSPNTKYYVRAYATNAAGTAYGVQVSFTTLAEMVVPTVTTSAATNVLAKTAEIGGNVTAWGGAEVTSRGVVWNTTGNPTTADAKAEGGNGLGSFNSLLFNLTPNTTYHVRAFATNSQGTGYGNEVTFTTQAQAANVTKVVAKDGTGDYTTVQAAFDAVPNFYTGKYTILVKPGTYYEKVILQREKVNVVLRGENPATAILTYDDYAGKNNLGTANSYSVAIEADDFTAVNITFQNTVKNDGSVGNQQAVALRTNGDRQAFYNCRILGYQDTYYAWGGRVVGRVYMKDCLLEGSVDFIFGRQVVVFDHCTIRVNRNGGMLTAASTEANTKHGFVFLNSTVEASAVGFDGNAITSFFLGRPWQAAPRTVFMNSVLPATLNPAGWSTWNTTPALYGEYNNTGQGAATNARSSISRLLTATEAADHTVAKIFARATHPSYSFDWMPEPVEYNVTGSAYETENKVSKLEQNYPNPFTGATTIPYEVKRATRVSLEVFDAMGKKVATVSEGIKQTGSHAILFRTSLPGGIYYYHLITDGGRSVRKMLVVQ
ncbi:pectinesterase family protein [Rufibacter ruber]|uniref:pectinesterase family protein n=1 Tax=Rufibacter ruber TaxID=1783499 RepID=UPI0009ED2DEA|nr:pectinesterase family protein [Rufibacter ruber]